jgi:hypothetical protein
MTDRQNNTTTKITPAVPIAEDPYGPRPELVEGRYMFYIPADALVMGKGYRPSIVFDGVAGHFPNGGGDVEPWYWGDTIDKARAIARKRNETLGLSEDDETRILASSVIAGRPADRIVEIPVEVDQAERIAEQNSTRAARLATRAEAASIEAADHAAQAERIAANRPYCRPLQNLATKALSYADGSIQAARTAASSAGYLADRIVEGKFDRSDEYLGAAAREFGIASEDRDQARAIASAAVVVAAHL